MNGCSEYCKLQHKQFYPRKWNKSDIRLKKDEKSQRALCELYLFVLSQRSQQFIIWLFNQSIQGSEIID